MNKALAEAINTIADYAHSVPKQNCAKCALEYWCEMNCAVIPPCEWEVIVLREDGKLKEAPHGDC